MMRHFSLASLSSQNTSRLVRGNENLPVRGTDVGASSGHAFYANKPASTSGGSALRHPDSNDPDGYGGGGGHDGMFRFEKVVRQ